MNLRKVLRELHKELAYLDRAIASLERLQDRSGKRNYRCRQELRRGGLVIQLKAEIRKMTADN